MLSLLKKYEQIMIQVVMVMMAIVLALCTIDLGWTILKDISKPPYFILDIEELLELFGLFMLVIIGIELLETIMKTYSTPGQQHHEVVLSVAIIAISRKIIILDMKTVDSMSLIGIAAITIALTIGYAFVRAKRPKQQIK
ncbi:phosphate-starvation-inducible PsiE family protein [Desulfosoma caldarium]|uniref:Uncharacterized membrane protein (DUF373 family) n=1 Tax=Desulfosoma caldarium TaxID=610254 RepID=A0A3N1V283_9BACT|nr:phosphate-starvation-inducible PsiE family protein [Desulfosoma caldarium]ROQ93616.1 uncharacterized membrane protein (DUF373 family) [Desulfosoma caldarium]